MSRLGDCEMENMKAVQVHNYGGPEVLRFEDAPRPTPESGELLIKVHAASVNAIDWKARAGYLKDVFPLPLPYIPGWDVSGIVEAIGPGVTQFKKGDQVYVVPDGARSGKGTYAEYVVVKETEAALKPKSVDHIHAAAIPLVALTAWQALSLAHDMSALQAARVGDHGRHGVLHAGRSGAGNEGTGSDFAGDGKEDHVGWQAAEIIGISDRQMRRWRE